MKPGSDKGRIVKDHGSGPIESPEPHAAWNICKWCGDTPIREVLDGDPLCQSCCNKWVAGEQSHEAG